MRVGQGHDELLYYYARHQVSPQSDVLSECLKNLAGLPAALAAELIEKYGGSDDEVVLVGGATRMPASTVHFASALSQLVHFTPENALMPEWNATTRYTATARIPSSCGR